MPEQKAQNQRLGIQVLFDFTDIIAAIDFAADTGFGVLEINLGNINFGNQLRRASERRKIKRQAGRRKVRLAVHALEGPSFFIPSERVRRCAVLELKKTLDWAADIGAENVIMHLGFDMHYGYGGGNRFTHEEFPRYYEEALLQALADLKQYARTRANLCVENVGGFRFVPSKKVLKRLLGGSLGLCFDIGHIAILSEDKKKEEFAFFKRFHKTIYHAHLHHNNGARDQHLALGEGTVDVVPYLRLLYKSPALLVFETRPKEQALKSRDYFERVLLPKIC
ncbi:MAG: sugar phosphate isomerase/epimerase [candidate division WOR-3 bacterium]